MKICIDPGHGGNDSGAVGPTGLYESKTNLAICEHLCFGLEGLGLSTVLTRDTNVYVSLETRCEIANDCEADFFISVHCNSDGPSSLGIESLYVSQKGEQLAKPIQEELIQATGDVDRGLKYRSDLYVLNGTNMPATLVEVGFISHPETEELLRDEAYRQLIADAIVTGLLKHIPHK